MRATYASPPPYDSDAPSDAPYDPGVPYGSALGRAIVVRPAAGSYRDDNGGQDGQGVGCDGVRAATGTVLAARRPPRAAR
ncbi:hypothetical protein GCM10009654_51930 [Streptomyces hebeiensis]|uniref:Uncharacterized protein n=1 Tax=Streptomyces hebeiensis TaxID=229486 RepID=A0ABN1V1A6_9ACTN